MTIQHLIKELEKLPKHREIVVAQEGDINTYEIINVMVEEDGEIVIEHR